MPCPASSESVKAVFGSVNDFLVSATSGAVQNMGIGELGAANTLLKRKFRFLFGISYCDGKQVSPSFVKMASRPDITIADTELNFLNETTWIPGKAKWETIAVTYYDAANAKNTGLFSWLATIYDFTSECRTMASKPKDYGGIGHILMLDGCGNPIEKWELRNMFPTSIKFGELDYGSDDVAEVELTLRYSNVTYYNNCGEQPKACPCTPCNQ